jgi:hypothetical protein
MSPWRNDRYRRNLDNPSGRVEGLLSTRPCHLPPHLRMTAPVNAVARLSRLIRTPLIAGASTRRLLRVAEHATLRRMESGLSPEPVTPIRRAAVLLWGGRHTVELARHSRDSAKAWMRGARRPPLPVLRRMKEQLDALTRHVREAREEIGLAMWQRGQEIRCPRSLPARSDDGRWRATRTAQP